MKNVLVIGGSLFVGRVFSIMASRNGGFNLFVVNRGNHPLSLERVAQYKCDRHDPDKIARLVPDIRYDALVDFCAYEPGEISSVIGALSDKIGQYIFISTASVYAPGDGFLDENAPIPELPANSNNAVAEYVRKKIGLEDELVESCGAAGIKYTILRPTFIYGPFNYAPRESYFIEKIAKKSAVPRPVDASSRFNFVYVTDIADALMKCIGNDMAFNEVFNLAADEIITYPQLFSLFERLNDGPFPTREVTVSQIEEEGLPLPFPLTGDTLTNGGKFPGVFDFKYTPFSEGMEKAFKIFYSLYTN